MIKKLIKYLKIKFIKNLKNIFQSNWLPFFKNKILILRGVNTKFRTNNSLENFNRIFKHNINMKNNMNLITYVDNPINLSIEQLNFFKSIINQQQKKKFI